MQTKKDELQRSIMEAAKHEFVMHGYEDSSMRLIAKRANTSIGNIYHYFPGKEALLSAIMDPYLESLSLLLNEHLRLNITVSSLEELNEAFEQVDFDHEMLRPLIQSEFVIFMRIKSTKYADRKEEFLAAFHQHLAWHLKCSDADRYIVICISNMMIESLIHLIKANKEKEAIKKDFMRFFKMICSGVINAELKENSK